MSVLHCATARTAAAALALATSATLLVGISPAAAQSSQAPSSQAQSSQGGLAPDTILVEGRGWGHGNGLSQWGALGYAVDHGWDSERIVEHFYSNTTLSEITEDDIWIHLTRNVGDLVLTSESDFSVAGRDFSGGSVARVGVTGGSFWVRRTTGCGARGDLVASGLSASRRRGDRYVEILPAHSDYNVDDIAKMLVVIYCRGSDAELESMRIAYRGALAVVDQGGAEAVNRVPIGQYLRGVVPRESIPEWGAMGDGSGIFALEAQAIAARSYVLATAVAREREGRFTDTCDSAACQVYEGAALNGNPLDHGTRYVHSNTAVANTTGQVLKHPDGRVAFAEFHSSSGGWTAGLDEGSHFPGVEDLGDDTSGNPNHTWQSRIRRADVEATFPEIGRLRCIEVTHRNGNGAWGGRNRGIRVVGTRGIAELDEYRGVSEGQWIRWAHDPFRRAFSLRSDWYRFPQFPPESECEPGPVESADDVSSTPSRSGLWVLKSDGTVFADGVATHLGNGVVGDDGDPFVAMAAHPDGAGYWLATAGGDVQAFGAADDHGTADAVMAEPVTAIAPHPGGDGYWLATADGTVIAFGAAAHWGGASHLRLGAQTVDIESSPDGDGYWLVLSDGRVLAFGDASDVGCGPLLRPGSAAIGLAVAPEGDGYWLAGSNTAVYAIGSVTHAGDRSANANRLRTVAVTPTASGDGYWLVWSDGTSFNYGDAPDYPTSRAGPGVIAAASIR